MASMTDKNHSQSAHQIFQSLSLLPTPEFVCLIDDCNRILVNKRQGEWCLWEDHLNSSGALPAEGVFVLSTTPSCTVCLRTLAALCPFPIEVPTNRDYVADILSASNPLAESDCEDVTECLRRQVFVFQGTRLRIFPVHLCRAMSSENLFNDDIGNAEIDIEHQNAVELEVMTQFGPHNTVARAENEPNFRHSRLHRIPRYNNRKDSSASAFDDAISSETGIAKQAEASMAALEMEELREENARLNSALACIREMMQQISGPARDLTTELSSDSAMFDYGETQTAVGIPITRKDEVFCPVLEEAHCHDWLQGAENLSYRDIWHRQHDNFEDTGEVTGVLEELNLDQEFNRCVQPPSVYRFKSGVGTEHFAYSTPCGSVSLDSTAPVSMESPSDSEGSRHRVKVADGACCLIDYQGDRPDALTEAAIERILDGPLHSVHRAARRDLARISANLKLRDSSRRSQRLWGKAVPRKQSSKHGVETPRTTINDLSKGLEPEGFAQNVEYDKNSDDDDDGITSGTISDGSPMAPSCTIAALQSSSPNSANFLAQYMADQISCRASLPVHKIQQTSDREEPNSQQRGIENMWKSAPSSVSLLKKSSFLLRRPVEDELLYG